MSLHTVEAAAQAHTEAYEALKREIQAAQDNGVPDAAIARAAGVSRDTVRVWTGKRKRA